MEGYYNYLNGTSSNIKTERNGLKLSPSACVNSVCDSRALNSRVSQSRTSQYSDDSIESSSNTSMESASPTLERPSCNKLKTESNLVSGYTDSSSSEYSESDVSLTTNALLSGEPLKGN